MLPTSQATTLYEHTYQRGWWHQIGAMLRGQSAALLNLTAVGANCPISARRYAGTQTVPIHQIRGSEGRCADFDDAFHPRQQHTAARWRGIAKVMLQGGSLPPVDLVRLGEIYFVRDGHHRISVARALGQQEIDAVVTVWDVVASQGAEWVAEETASRKAARMGQGRIWGVAVWSSLWPGWRRVQPNQSASEALSDGA